MICLTPNIMAHISTVWAPLLCLRFFRCLLSLPPPSLPRPTYTHMRPLGYKLLQGRNHGTCLQSPSELLGHGQQDYLGMAWHISSLQETVVNRSAPAHLGQREGPSSWRCEPSEQGGAR